MSEQSIIQDITERSINLAVEMVALDYFIAAFYALEAAKGCAATLPNDKLLAEVGRLAGAFRDRLREFTPLTLDVHATRGEGLTHKFDALAVQVAGQLEMRRTMRALKPPI